MHLSGEEAAAINISIGAGLTWIGTALTQHRTREDAKGTLRRDAYTVVILALDHLDRVWTAPGTLDDETSAKTLGTITGQAVGAIEQATVPVLLTGSKRASDPQCYRSVLASGKLRCPDPTVSRHGLV